jgi:two-component system chemotaxis response regulator CheB
VPALLESLVHRPAGEPVSAPDNLKYEVEIARSGRVNMDDLDRIGRMDDIGQRSVLSCPDCGGVLWELDEGSLLRYRCHVGHAYTAELMSLAVDESLRRARASALRALDERTALVQKLREQAAAKGRNDLAAIWARKGREFIQEARIIEDSIRRLNQMAAHAAAAE